MPELRGVCLKLILEQGTIKQHLNGVRLLGYWRRWIRREPYILALARFLLYDGHVAVFLIQKVKSSLNAENLAEERRFKNHVALIIIAYHIWQRLTYQMLYVTFLNLCVLLELRIVTDKLWA